MTDTLDETMDLLRRTPDLVRRLLVGLPESWTETPDVDGGWTPHDVVGHLISAELDDWIPRTERILTDGVSKPFDPFDRFAQLRSENLARLAALASDADLDRRGLHAALGEVTLRELLATWAVHDLDHISQIFAGLAGSHDTDVGRWKAYLGILLRRDDPAATPG